ncbi:hypothetical protein K501DRAFT_272076 [Backusella circina FSU 941]|nr:hypothetical protein K501DRAFT_272076 [Backusella circina FSU 941]
MNSPSIVIEITEDGVSSPSKMEKLKGVAGVAKIDIVDDTLNEEERENQRYFKFKLNSVNENCLIPARRKFKETTKFLRLPVFKSCLDAHVNRLRSVENSVSDVFRVRIERKIRLADLVYNNYAHDHKILVFENLMFLIVQKLVLLVSFEEKNIAKIQYFGFFKFCIH